MPATLFTSYDDSGRIISAGRASNPHEQVPETGGVFIGAQFDGDLFWFDAGLPQPRPEAPAIRLSADSVTADGVAVIELLGVPTHARVDFGGQVVTADGGPIELTTNMVGWNTVSVEAFPAQRWTGGFRGTAN